MDKSEFLSSLAEVLQTETNIDFDTVLNDLYEWDSLSKIATIAFLDKNFNVQSNITEINSFITVNDIAKKAGI